MTQEDAAPENKTTAEAHFLPEFRRDADEVFDIILVTGDAYVDHPAFGAAMIGRHLESLGYKVGIIAQPDWQTLDDFQRLGKPRLFFGVTAGNLDSMVANHSSRRQRRRDDAYTPGGKPGKRPDLACLIYAQKLKQAYPDAPLVLGGIEASLRRVAHYDYVQQKVRGSILADAKADYLVYGMGERAVARLAEGFAKGRSVEWLRETPGVAYLAKEVPEGPDVVVLPTVEEAAEDKDLFLAHFQQFAKAVGEIHPPVIVQPQAGRYVVVNPPSAPLTPAELDGLYQLPFTRAVPPRYAEMGGVPALEPVRFSITTHRGCYGGCNFCALYAHQGKAVVSRPQAGILAEVKRLTKHPDWKGTIQDVGGPTANMYGTHCKEADPGRSGCTRRSCLAPEKCRTLEDAGAPFLELLRAIRKVRSVKHVFVASGIRHDLITQPTQRRLFRELMQHHVGGVMKIAPEHVARRPLALMGKPPVSEFVEFMRLFKTMRDELDKRIAFVPYLMVGHPGTNLEDAIDLARYAKRLGNMVDQVQTFTPTPLSASSVMYYTRKDPFTGDAVFVPNATEAQAQKELVQHKNPANHPKLREFFRKINRPDLADELLDGGRKPTRGRQGAPRGRSGPGGKRF